jgi:glutathione S-transferase
MVLKFYTHPLSPPAQRVALILRELEVPFEAIHVDLLAGENKTPEYTAKQPHGQVPCIVCCLNINTELPLMVFTG